MQALIPGDQLFVALAGVVLLPPAAVKKRPAVKSRLYDLQRWRRHRSMPGDVRASLSVKASALLFQLSASAATSFQIKATS